MKKVQLLTFAFLTAALTLSSCSSDDDNPEHIHDHEGIEELVVTRTDADGSNPVEYIFEYGNAVGTDMNLSANTIYNFEITALNAHHDGEEENLIPEVIEAKDEHFFVFAKSNSLDFAAFSRTDDAVSTRTDGHELGIKFQVTTGNSSSGNFQVELKHQPTAVDANAQNGYGSATGGATDVLATYPVTILE